MKNKLKKSKCLKKEIMVSIPNVQPLEVIGVLITPAYVLAAWITYPFPIYTPICPLCHTARPGMSGIVPIAVSYTHLRAHETSV